MTENRKRALRKRRIFLSVCAVVLIAAIAVLCFAVSSIIKLANGENTADTESVKPAPSSAPQDTESDPYSKPDMVTVGDYTLDANYSRLLLVNAEYPLPQDYNYGWNLTKIEAKYHNGQLDQIDAGIWPYMKAMVEAAWKDGVKLYVWSPYRSYDTQKMLFDNRVKKERGDEAKAATAVARPGTSEHNTGLCADFNMASSQFEDTEMFRWMCEHAEDYGFILRYPKGKEEITGYAYEPWHFRYVGVDYATAIYNVGEFESFEEYFNVEGGMEYR